MKLKDVSSFFIKSLRTLLNRNENYKSKHKKELVFIKIAIRKTCNDYENHELNVKVT